MSANVETMFSVRTTPWHGLGTIVSEAPNSKEALVKAGLDWKVIQEDAFKEDGMHISGYKVNIRDSDMSILGVVTDKYQIVQNDEAFAFTDAPLNEGVVYETAGSLQGGRRTWILAKAPEKYIIAGDFVEPYFVLMNSHDGSCSVKAAMTPIRVVCQNTLNLALSTAKRTWSMKHTGGIKNRIDDAMHTLRFAEAYMTEFGKGVESLCHRSLSERKVLSYINEFFPVAPELTDSQKKNSHKLREELKVRYFDAPDLMGRGHNGYRFINAVSDFATHAEPIRRTKNYQENLFLKTTEGNALIDRAYELVRCA